MARRSALSVHLTSLHQYCNSMGSIPFTRPGSSGLKLPIASLMAPAACLSDKGVTDVEQGML
jgi:hypothetical protein